ncbi:IclR family transcriptional regulator [Defluviimonas sp. CAU 1641]|uniref:IclR family transcriptional regulator n=2 Tax=Defluviimonas salinarum TaxID=2992147 RepID=A0ABT3J9Z1_9RHOB|nr:HTH-type transcriptional regulator BhcR [Defluviimonas salinarum]MCW3784512.1 IclR family transcriptional regulator [Defluviimonas salinarum]
MSQMAESRPRGRPKSFHDKTAENTIQSLDRALMILKVVSEAGGLTLSELAARTEQSAPTVYRVLTTLQTHGFVEMEEPGQLWHVGGGAYRVGSQFLRRTKVVERARQPMDRLMRETGETANLGVEMRDQVLFLAQVETHETIRAFFAPGTLSPMHASGIGKALLAWYPEARVRAIAARGLARFTAQSLAEEPALIADLARIRSRGFAIDDEERTDGMRCVAAPIFNAHGEPVAGLSVSGPTFRLTADRAAGIGAEVRRAADEVTLATGGRMP